MHKTSKYLKHKKLMCLTALVFMLFSTVTSSTETTNYTYDDMSRLIRVEYDDGTVIDYVYDNMGRGHRKGSGLPDMACIITNTKY